MSKGEIAVETEDQFDQRLCRVIAQAETTFYQEHYRWTPLDQPSDVSPLALATVRDDETWNQFVPATRADDPQQFVVVRFNFSETGPSAIGFVAWLHSHLRTMGRTGAIVICGKDARSSSALFEICQGAMDYWACPTGAAGDRFLNVIKTLIDRGNQLEAGDR